MKHLGDFDASSVVYGKFTTYRPSTGAAFTLGGSPALAVYKDNSVSESLTGVTLIADFDGRVGLNHFAINTGADGTFYSSGSFFDIVITAGTVDGVSVVGSVVASFTVRKNSALKPATAGRTLVVDTNGLADATAVKVGPSGSGAAQTAGDISAQLSAINAKTTNLPATPAAVGSAMTLTLSERDSVADAFLNRDMSVGTDSGSPTVRTPRQALRVLRNKVSVSGTSMTVTKEDDVTTSWSATVTATPGADPITAIDPA